eukprot:scaffold516_cov401-Prasinococcus_capsulatus_cf.AAC.24
MALRRGLQVLGAELAARARGPGCPKPSSLAYFQRRHLNVHEYQGAELMAEAGVNVPRGIICSTPDEVASAAEKLKGSSGEVVVKSQILAGGRGVGTFKNGFQGGVHIVPAEVRQAVGVLPRWSLVLGMIRSIEPSPLLSSACCAGGSRSS